MAIKSLMTDNTQTTKVKSMPQRTTARRLLFSARILMFSKNCTPAGLSLDFSAFSPPGSRSIFITEYKVMALTTWRGPSAKTVFIQARYGSAYHCFPK